jgi:hypothetical protein
MLNANIIVIYLLGLFKKSIRNNAAIYTFNTRGGKSGMVLP